MMFPLFTDTLKKVLFWMGQQVDKKLTWTKKQITFTSQIKLKKKDENL